MDVLEIAKAKMLLQVSLNLLTPAYIFKFFHNAGVFCKSIFVTGQTGLIFMTVHSPCAPQKNTKNNKAE